MAEEKKNFRVVLAEYDRQIGRLLREIKNKLEQIRRNGKMAEEKKEKFESSYPKGVRIAAIIGVIFLVALYIVTLIAGITTSKAAPELFKMCIGSSILLPILFWLYIQFAKSFMNRDRENIKKEK